MAFSNNISANSKINQFKLICDSLINKKQNSQKMESTTHNEQPIHNDKPNHNE